MPQIQKIPQERFWRSHPLLVRDSLGLAAGKSWYLVAVHVRPCRPRGSTLDVSSFHDLKRPLK